MLLRETEGRLDFTEDAEAAVLQTLASFVVVPTPSDRSGAFSSRYVLEACESIGRALRRKLAFHVVVITSTVMPGTTCGEVVPLLERESGKECGRDFGVCYGPEFVALGSVIRDFLNPDFVLIGESDPWSGMTLEMFYRTMCLNDPPVARMSLINAELAKIAVNTYVTTKIAFANMLARICEKTAGADVDVVTSAIGLDSRIGRKYLKGAIGYGGPCFPRDNRALATHARRVGTDAALAEATDVSNRAEVSLLLSTVRGALPQSGTVAILGLAYKPNSHVVEESPGLLLAQQLAAAGISVVTYDPAAANNARHVLESQVGYASSAEECVEQADVVVVTTPWDDFRRLGPDCFSRGGRPRVLIDCWRMFDHHHVGEGVRYIPLGRGQLVPAAGLSSTPRVEQMSVGLSRRETNPPVPP
jgi:UDPglucose 6-dehydrogenase